MTAALSLMLQSRATAVFALAVFLFGGWLPTVLHGPPHAHAAFDGESAGHEVGERLAAGRPGCSCHHHGHAANHDSEKQGGERQNGETTHGSEQTECPVCDLISVLTLPAAAFAQPALVQPTPPGPKVFVRVDLGPAVALPPLRGPPAV